LRRVVWVNATNLFDAAAPFGGLRESGFGREGGWEGMQAYLKPDIALKPAKPVDPAPQPETVDAPGSTARPRCMWAASRRGPMAAIRSRLFAKRGTLLGHAGIGNRKDIRNAVEAARGAVAGWAEGHRPPAGADPLLHRREPLGPRDEFAARIHDLTGTTAGAPRRGRASVDRLFTYAAWADKFDGVAKSVPIRGVALAMREPVGVIGLLCAGRRAASGRGLAAGARHRDGQPRGAGAVLARAAGRHRPLPGARHLGRAGGRGQYRHRRSGGVGRTLAVPSRRGCALVLLATRRRDGRSRPPRQATSSALDQPRRQPGLGVTRRGRRFLDAATEVKTIWVPYGE
jgi:aldehyde dehydrogenase (NAD+)